MIKYATLKKGWGRWRNTNRKGKCTFFGIANAYNFYNGIANPVSLGITDEMMGKVGELLGSVK